MIIPGFPGSSVGKDIALMHETRFSPWVEKMTWTREWLPTLGFLPGEFHRQGNLAGYSPWSQRVGHG